MINKLGVCWGWRLGLMGCCLVWPIVFCGYAEAQSIQEDATLGAESSRVIRNVRIRSRDGIERDSDRIDGGARRGANLFHSFEQFDVLEGRGAYFSNPDGIRNILSRVTGGDRSEIFGVLGVLGDANLFFLNPNGIVFGPNSSLDISSSFLATTADGISLGDQGFFSATAPEQSNLLDVNPGALFFNQVNAQGGVINSTGTLAAGQDLTLAGQNLDLQGQLLARGNLTLQAKDTLRIRDSVTNPFVAASGGQMLVQGDRVVDIFALNHPNSGLVSGGDMVLRSASQVGGDAHYWSGGNFRIEQLDGSLGDLYSPYDPIILVSGDISFNDYTGASLHILAGGAVTATGLIGIIETGSSSDTISPITTPELANLTTSDGRVRVIDGSSQPTLDVRAGIDWSQLGGSPGDIIIGEPLPSSVFAGEATSANISIGSIALTVPNGSIFLTNQYTPNSLLSGGTIEIGDITTGDAVEGLQGNSGSIIIDSRDSISITNYIDSSSNTGNAGNIDLIASNNILLDNSYIFSNTYGAGGGGDITVTSRNLLVQNGGGIAASTTSTGAGGNLVVNASELTQLIGRNPNNSSVPSGLFVRTSGEGRGGNLTINTGRLIIQDGGLVTASTLGEGQGGDLTIDSESVEVLGTSVDGRFIGSALFATARNIGAAGNLTITTRRLVARDGGQVSVGTFSRGQGGNLTINATDSIELSGRSANGRSDSGLFARAEGFGSAGNITISTDRLLISDDAEIAADTLDEGNGGTLTINADQLILRSVGSITTSTSGEGNAGNLFIYADSLDLSGTRVASNNRSFSSGIFARVERDSEGNGGNLTVEARQLTLADGAKISTEVIGDGQGGNLNVSATESIELLGRSAGGLTPSAIFARTESRSENSDAGDLTITTDRLLVQDGAQVAASTFGAGNAGDLFVRANSIELSGTSINGFPGGLFAQVNRSSSSGNGGNLTLETKRLLVQNGAQVTASTSGAGNAGNINIYADDIDLRNRSTNGIPSGLFARTDGFSLENISNLGNGGDINIEAERLSILGGSGISVATGGNGDAGNLRIVASRIEISNPGSAVEALTSGSGDAGDINLSVDDLSVQDEAQILASTVLESKSDLGRSGNITIQNANRIFVDNSSVSTAIEANTSSQGQGGNINIQSRQLILNNDAKVTASTSGLGDAGDISVYDTETVVLSNSSLATTANADAIGQGGSINIATGSLDLDQAQINSSTSGQGNTGSIAVQASQGINLNNLSSITTDVQQGATGNSQQITLQTPILTIAGNSEVSAATAGNGNAGSIAIEDADSVILDNSSISTAIKEGAIASQSSNISLQARQLSLNNNAGITASTAGQGDAGTISVQDAETVSLVNNSAISTAVDRTGIGNGGSINVETDSLDLTNSRITSSTGGQGDTGQIAVQASENIRLDNSQITNAVETGATGNSQNITLSTPQLRLNNSEISAATDGRGRAGSIAIQGTASNTPATRVSLNNSTLSTEIQDNGTVNSQDDNSRSNIDLRTRQLDLNNGSDITASTSGQGDAGTIRVRDADTISLEDQSRITTTVNQGAIGDGGNIDIYASNLNLRGDSTISAATNGTGRAGDVRVLDADQVSLSNSRISTEVGKDATIPDGSNRNASSDSRSRSTRNPQSNITINTRSLDLDNNARITARTRGQGNAGDITVNADTVNIENGSRLTTSTSSDRSAGNILLNVQDATEISGNGSGIFANTEADGNGGSITLNTDTLTLNDRARISAQSTGRGEAGDIRINANTLNATNSTLETAARRASGGTIKVNPNDRTGRITLNNSTITTNSGDQGGNIRLGADQMILRGDSDITTSSGGNGGNIDITAASIIAFDDSDILADSNNARGGNITLDTPAFFGSGYVPDQTSDSSTLNGNGHVDINASGSTASGTIRTPDTSFIQNSLSDLPDNSIDTDQLLANSCIVRDRNQPQGQFIITGADGLPDRPGSITLPDFPTGEIRNIPSDAETNDQPWQLGDPVVEPQGVYRLPDGRLVMSRECDE